MRIEYIVTGPHHPDLFDGMTPIREPRIVDLRTWVVRYRLDGDDNARFIELAATSRKEARSIARRILRAASKGATAPKALRVEGELPREPDGAEIETWQELREWGDTEQ